ncbi:NAD-dependent epimerase/dehydratase family protein [Streptomyces atroolivaceus]|uniref:NAD-dependent epimerase/dehydratase family protein n=1 Tax=Streptomyces atroolivaceus TaxID=66869 RepID=UPI0034138827
MTFGDNSNDGDMSVKERSGMRVAVAGGTGLVGRYVVEELAATGQEPVVLARSQGVDLVTGAGLDAAMAGVEVVVDVSNVTTTSGKKAIAFFEQRRPQPPGRR